MELLITKEDIIIHKIKTKKIMTNQTVDRKDIIMMPEQI